MNAKRRSGYTLIDLLMNLYIFAMLILFLNATIWADKTFGLHAIVDRTAAAVGVSRELAENLLLGVQILLTFAMAGLASFGTLWSLCKLGTLFERDYCKQGYVHCDGTTKFRLVFEQCPPGPRHGVAIDFSHIRIDDNGYICKKRPAPSPIVRWADAMPGSIEFEVPADTVMIELTPVRDAGEGAVKARRRRAYLKYSEIPDGRRFRCNDGISYKNDADFDHFVFRIERII